MKVRTNYVSNSSSSSFLIAYDKSFFGDLLGFFNGGVFYSCRFKDSAELEEAFYSWFDDDEECAKYRKLVDDAENSGKTVIYLDLSYDYVDTFKLLEHINAANGGDKMEVFYRTDD